MSYIVACNRQTFFGHQFQMPKLRSLITAVLMGGLVLAGSVIVAISWLPVSVQQANVSEAEFYLQDSAATPTARKDLADSISASTVLGTTLR